MKRLQSSYDLFRIIAGGLVLVAAGCKQWRDSDLSGLDHAATENASDVA